MVLKERLLSLLERSQAVQKAFVAGLPDDLRFATGTYEAWCAKDALAHAAYWIDHRATVEAARARGDELPPAVHFEQANAACYQRFCNCSWDEVQAFADAAYARLAEAVNALSEAQLAAPDPRSGRPVWQDIVGTAYSHLIEHIAGFHVGSGQSGRAGQLWSEWGGLVAPLDTSAQWQGLVHYNVACGLSLSGNADAALAELRQALQLRPDFTAWSRQDSDLRAVRDKAEYRTLYAPEYWWAAMEAGPQAEAMADQFVRTLAMLREAVMVFPADEWRKGDTPYQRPAGLALHTVEAIDDLAVLKRGESGRDRRFGVDWEEQDSARLPSQEELLAYLGEVDRRLARFLAGADLLAGEDLFRWTGSTLLSRMAYVLRHTQHHLAEMCLELHRRGYKAPPWQ